MKVNAFKRKKNSNFFNKKKTKIKIHQAFQLPKPGLITKLKWSPLNLNDKSSKCLTKLAIADDSANVFIWNTNEQRLIHELNDSAIIGYKINGSYRLGIKAVDKFEII
jgi:hypothetical protein